MAELLLCATSVFSVSLWLSVLGENHHRDTKNTERAQRNLKLERYLKNAPVAFGWNGSHSVLLSQSSESPQPAL